MEILTLVKTRAQKWLDGNYDDKTKQTVQNLLDTNEKELIDCFYKDLEFGTGGLRGIMGVGTNRMNIYTVGMAAQGLCNYVKENFSGLNSIKAAIAYDSRNNSKLYAETVAKIFSANGFKAFLFDELKPTPELSFAVRYLGCQTGVVITASHNPKEYNGFKVYWNDGGQIIAPHDTNIVNKAKAIKNIEEVKWEGNSDNIVMIGDKIDHAYLTEIKKLSLSPEAVKNQNDLKIVYTPIHGTGVKLVPAILREFGFTNIYNVPEQDIPDGNFPTVVSPNPEETAAMDMALKKAVEVNADIVMASDPDADRIGMAVKDFDDKFILLNGNQTGTILIYYLIKKWKENNKLTGKEYIVKTIVTTDLISDIAKKYSIEHFEVLTGFKYIADKIKENEGQKTFIGGGEESYGYLAGEFVRDKDAVMSCALIIEAVAWAKDQGKSAYELLAEIYQEIGLYKENLISVVKKGITGAEEIQKMMSDFRANPLQSIDNSTVILTKDYFES